ncbi:MAG: hypothetical protein A2051_01070 [Desulfovibrionales bacterium GWA2_65_9]|nr:MAG: hypothetical protein A2051_01070 [Desulfovibrionales bacterium GWA2_65_9]
MRSGSLSVPARNGSRSMPALLAALLAALRTALLVALLTLLAPVSSLPVVLAASPPAPEAASANVEIVLEFYRHFANGNPEGMRALLVPEAEWTVTGQHTLAGTKTGLEAIRQLLWQLKRAGIAPEAYMIEGRGAHVLDVRQGLVKRGGVNQDFFWVRVYELRNGKIVKVQDFPSDQQAADVFFWQACPPKPEETLIRD